MLLGTVGASVIVARWLGPEGLGSLAVLNTTIVLALSIGSLGLTSANTYFIAKDRLTLAPVWANAIVFALLGERWSPSLSSGSPGSSRRCLAACRRS